MLVRAYTALAPTPDELFVSISEADRNLRADELIDALVKFGLPTAWASYIKDDGLFRFMLERRPVIALVQYAPLRDAGLTTDTVYGDAHFVTVVGVDCAKVYIHDPLCQRTPPTAVPWGVWREAWEEAGNHNDNPPRAGLMPVRGLGEATGNGVSTDVASGASATNTKPRQAVVNAPDGLNVRSGPGVQYAVVHSLVAGTPVTLYEERNGWARIVDRGEWWCCMDWLRPA
jgi:hypothetical protein